MKYCFLNSEFDKKSLLSNEISGINRFLLENNTKQVEQIYDFLAGSTSLLLINGFMGTGKTAILEHTLSSFNGIVLNYNCFETTILDDILLTFFEEFQKLIALEKITAPKTKSENFIQKINTHFESIEKPIIVIINSFEEILKINKPEILGFINHLCTMKNVKVVLISRSFDVTEFEHPYEKVTILALEKSIFEKYLRSEDFKQIGPLSDELYKHSRGYFFYTNLSMKIMKLRNLGLIDFLNGFSKSFLTFNDFILREALALVDPVSGHLFRFLTIMRHPISIKLLKTLQLYNEERVLFFLNNLVLSRFGEYIYLQDYYKIIAENSISDNVAIKLHQGCVDLYNTQLPLKPLERDLVISRQTMRNEIEYHNNFIPKKTAVTLKEPPKKMTTSSVPATVPEENIPDIKEQKDEKIKNLSFIFEEDEFGVLDKIADSIKNFLSFSDKRSQEDKEENKLSLTELMNKAKQEETNFDYKHAISLYLKALALKNDEDYYTYLPSIYNKLGFNYQNLSNWYDAQKYFEMAEDFYNSTGDIEKINETRYNIANIFYMTFKRDKAKTILNEILKEITSDELKVKTYNFLANLTSNANIAYEYYKKALEINPLNISKNVLSELYYKFALTNEDIGDEETAVLFYKKCITLDAKNNPHISDALSNLALLYDDIGERDLAIKYYLESLKIDEVNKNFNGIYSSSMKLGEIYSVKQPEKALEYFNKALDYANKLNEDFYIISTNTALGDFYFNKKNNETALRHFKIAYKHASNSTYTENAEKIQLRINDIKIKIGEERFNELEK